MTKELPSKTQLITHRVDSAVIAQKWTFYVPGDHSCFGKEILWLVGLTITGRISANDIPCFVSLHNYWTLNEIRTNVSMYDPQVRRIAWYQRCMVCYYSQGRNKVNKIKSWVGMGFLLIYILRYQCLLCQYYEACLFLFYFQIWLPLSSHVIQTRDVNNRDWTWKSENLWDFSIVPHKGIEKSGRKSPVKEAELQRKGF